ncbi:MAG: FkbM family methyltransferase [Pseudomonadota bacterium]
MKFLKGISKRRKKSKLRKNSMQSERRKKQLLEITNDIIGLYEFILEKNCGKKLKTKAQLGQDAFALIANDFKRDGFFVEFGATNGVDLSNSFLLEKSFGWRGILAEPSPAWHSALYENRDCFIEPNCVWKESGKKLKFDVVKRGEFSTLSQFSAGDMHSETRKKSNTILIETISLLDLLKKYDAPLKIDYLSVDTEGSEFDILSVFEFEQYRFGCITVEHNFTPQRSKIHDLLVENGYKRVFPNLSRFDDWYIEDR